MIWRFLVLIALASTISLGRESLSSYAEPSRQSSTQITPKLAQSAIEYLNRANEKYKKGDYQEAIADYTQAINLKPNYAEAYNNRGLAKAALEESKGAIADYTEAIRISPDYAEAYNNRGVLKVNLEDNKGAIFDFIPNHLDRATDGIFTL